MAQPGEVLNKHYRAMMRLLCSSKLHPIKRSKRVRRNTDKDAPGWKSCRKPCPICPYTLDDYSEIVGQITGYTHKVSDAADCNTENCIYFWKCTKPNCSEFPRCEYIGMTTRPFRERLAEHRDYPKKDVLTEPSGEHRLIVSDQFPFST